MNSIKQKRVNFTGGAGADTFFFLTSGESDRITDFENGIDKMTIGLA